MKLKVRGEKKLPADGIERVLIRGTNWIGDVVMTLPAVAAVRRTWPGARISVLAKPWVAEVYRLSPDVGELQRAGFDCAILLQNAVEAAVLALLAGIPLRAGYNSDGRGLLLTHSVRRTQAIRRVHQIDYYIEMIRALGCMPAGRGVRLRPGADYAEIAKRLCGEFGIEDGRPLIGIAPGAAYGPAKKWFPERFAAVADRLSDATGAQVVLLGSGDDRANTAAVQKDARGLLIDIAGKTDLKGAISLISRCALFISNDSGLMHVAGALGVPTIAVFGSTNPAATSPVGEKSIVIHHDVPCGPCLKPVCPTDFRCMEMIGVDEVYAAARKLLDDKRKDT